MRVLSTCCSALIILAALLGCSSSDVELSTIKKDAQDLGVQVSAMKTKIGALEESVGKLNDRNSKVADEFTSLQGTVEQLRDQGKAQQSQSDSLAEAYSKLDLSYKKLAKLVTETMANWSKSRTELENKQATEAPAPDRAIQARKPEGNDKAGSHSGRASAEVCEALDRYMRELDSIMRRGPSGSIESKMDEALNDFKAVAGKFRDQKEVLQIWTLTEELKWTSYNAAKSRIYLTESGGKQWMKLVQENRRKLRQFCGD